MAAREKLGEMPHCWRQTAGRALPLCLELGNRFESYAFATFRLLGLVSFTPLHLLHFRCWEHLHHRTSIYYRQQDMHVLMSGDGYHENSGLAYTSL